MLDTTAEQRAQAVLDDLGQALEAGDIDRAKALFATDCHWRDLVSFTWNIRTLEGPDQVADMLRAQLGHIAPTGWRVDPAEPVSTTTVSSPPGSSSRPRSGAVMVWYGCATARSGPC